MAVIKLGSIVTGIAGSIGGTTFRRTKNGNSALNKPKGPAKARIKGTQSLQVLRQYIQAWGNLAPEDQDDWNAEAPNYLFPDKFGDLKALSGRQLYIKLGNRRALTGFSLPVPLPSDSTVPSLVTYNLSVDTIPGPTAAQLSVRASDPVYIVYGIRRITRNTSLPDYNKFVAAGYVEYTATDGSQQNFDVTSEVLAKIPNPTDDTWYMFIFYPQNAQGFRGAPVFGKDKVNGF